MHTLDAATVYNLSGGNGELFLIILIAFGVGALFGRTIMSPPPQRQLNLFAPKKILKHIRKEEPDIIITPLPRP